MRTVRRFSPVARTPVSAVSTSAPSAQLRKIYPASEALSLIEEQFQQLSLQEDAEDYSMKVDTVESIVLHGSCTVLATVDESEGGTMNWECTTTPSDSAVTLPLGEISASVLECNVKPSNGGLYTSMSLASKTLCSSMPI
ncbi:hypothetical protein EDD21DRAFT_350532 [Dissophora ornata]|nr:hypothetical protein EDD21DRAFT_350532 [Dissophora ornata]